VAAVALAGTSAQAQSIATTDCLSYPGDPEPGTPEWDDRDQNNIYCAIEGYMTYNTNPAESAAESANSA
jgi:hypothetical protein